MASVRALAVVLTSVCFWLLLAVVGAPSAPKRESMSVCAAAFAVLKAATLASV